MVTIAYSATARRVSNEHEPTASVLSYTVGLALAILATIASFVVAQTNLLWPPGIPVGLVVLAFAQIGVHLVFFLHLGSGPDQHQQYSGPRLWGADRLSGHHRLALDHRQPQRQHDADAYALSGKAHDRARSACHENDHPMIRAPAAPVPVSRNSGRIHPRLICRDFMTLSKAPPHRNLLGFTRLYSIRDARRSRFIRILQARRRRDEPETPFRDGGHRPARQLAELVGNE